MARNAAATICMGIGNHPTNNPIATAPDTDRLFRCQIAGLLKPPLSHCSAE